MNKTIIQNDQIHVSKDHNLPRNYTLFPPTPSPHTTKAHLLSPFGATQPVTPKRYVTLPKNPLKRVIRFSP